MKNLLLDTFSDSTKRSQDSTLQVLRPSEAPHGPAVTQAKFIARICVHLFTILI